MKLGKRENEKWDVISQTFNRLARKNPDILKFLTTKNGEELFEDNTLSDRDVRNAVLRDIMIVHYDKTFRKVVKRWLETDFYNYYISIDDVQQKEIKFSSVFARKKKKMKEFLEQNNIPYAMWFQEKHGDRDVWHIKVRR